jgi:amino acid transporter
LEPQQHSGLVRAIGRWTLTALVVNSILGSGIFALPDDIARWLGRSAPYAYLLAGAGIGLIMACFAEVSSQFTGAGGPYVYAREAFGRWAGIQVGWLAWLVRLTSGAANANLFVVYMGQFFPRVTSAWPRALLLVGILGVLAFVNVRGVRAGARLSNGFTLAKLVPLVAFIAAGAVLVGGRIRLELPSPSSPGWLDAVLALVFAFGGFEAALMPMGEAENPRRDAPFALFTALLVIVSVYLAVHLVVMGAFDDPAAFDRAEVRERPVGEAARVFLGSAGATLIALGVLVSTAGNLTAQFVSAPRLPFALAEQGDFPRVFARVHPRFRSPHVAILAHAVLVCALAVYGNFIWNAILAAVARLFTYAPVCAALIVLRRRRPAADAYRLPAGVLCAVLGVAFCALLVAKMSREHLWILLVIGAVASTNWLLVRARISAGS